MQAYLSLTEFPSHSPLKKAAKNSKCLVHQAHVRSDSTISKCHEDQADVVNNSKISKYHMKEIFVNL